MTKHKLSRKKRKLMKNNVTEIKLEVENIELDSKTAKAEPITFGRICGLVANIIILIAISAAIIAAWLYCVFNFNKGFWSILIVGMPFSLIIITLSIFFLDKMSEKVWGIPFGFAFGTVLINLGLFPVSWQKNIMYFSVSIYLIAGVIVLFIFLGLIEVFIEKIPLVFKFPVFYIFAGILIFNKSFDDSKIVTYDVTVVRKWDSDSEYMIKFDDGEQSMGIKKIEVLEDEYDCYEKGDHIRLLCRNGALGLPYVESYYEVE